ncbi:hypothetical protein ACFL0R_00200 [Pseudomonadota bacterium]
MAGSTLTFHQYFNNTTRVQAFLIHLGVSLAIFFILATILIFFWYPGPFFSLEGGWKGIRIVAFVDIVLGPALTLLVFKPGKPGLKFDMTLIIAAQVAALTWGVWTVSQARPALIVFADDAFYSITASKLKNTQIPSSKYDAFVSFTPTWVYADLPEDVIERANIITNTIKEGRELPLLFELYTLLKPNLEKVMPKQLPITYYVKFLDESTQNKFQAYMASLDKPIETLAFFPLLTSYGRGIVILEQKTSQVAGFLDIPYDPALGDKSRRMAAQEKRAANDSP